VERLAVVEKEAAALRAQVEEMQRDAYVAFAKKVIAKAETSRVVYAIIARLAEDCFWPVGNPVPAKGGHSVKYIDRLIESGIPQNSDEEDVEDLASMSAKLSALQHKGHRQN
jgi:hypothetical protein